MPLGLLGKWPKWPLLTGALFLGLFSYSFHSFKRIEQYRHSLIQLNIKLELYKQRSDLFHSQCMSSSQWPSRFCDAGSAMIGAMGKLYRQYGQSLENAAVSRKLLANKKNRSHLLLRFFEVLQPETGSEKVSSSDSQTKFELYEKLMQEEEYQKFFSHLEPYLDAENRLDFDSGKKYWMDYSAFQRILLSRKLEVHKEYHFLSHGNQTGRSYLDSQFIHSGWVHLLGNLFFLVVFGSYVEFRLGALRYIALYLVGGIAGLAAQVNVFTDPQLNPIVMGSSASISAIMGAFYLLFYHRRIRLLLMYAPPIPWGQIYAVPIKYLLPLFYLSSDLIGFVAGSFSGFGNLAYGAHIVGFLTGIIFGWWFRKRQKLANSLQYNEELVLHQLMLKSFDAQNYNEALVLFRQIEQLNPDNLFSLNAFMQKSLDEEFIRDLNLSYSQKEFYRSHLSTYFAQSIRRGNYSSAHLILSRLPYTWSLSEYLESSSSKVLLKLINWEIKQDHWFEVLRLYNVYLNKYPKGSEVSRIYRNTKIVIDHVKVKHVDQFEEHRFKIIDFMRSNPTSPLMPLLKIGFQIEEMDLNREERQIPKGGWR